MQVATVLTTSGLLGGLLSKLQREVCDRCDAHGAGSPLPGHHRPARRLAAYLHEQSDVLPLFESKVRADAGARTGR
jgi:hypothetical protein